MEIKFKNSKRFSPVECSRAIPLKQNHSAGFTLVELLVVIATFVVITITAVDLFVLMISHQRRILAEQELLNQTSYVTEYMSRALRMATKATDTACISTIGKNYEITTTGMGIKFINASNIDSLGKPICQEFRLEGGRIQEIKNSGVAVPLTSGTIEIQKFNIKLYGDTAGDKEQPRVAIAIDVKRQTKDFQLDKQMQVTVSQRNLDEE